MDHPGVEREVCCVSERAIGCQEQSPCEHYGHQPQTILLLYVIYVVLSIYALYNLKCICMYILIFASFLPTLHVPNVREKNQKVHLNFGICTHIV